MGYAREAYGEDRSKNIHWKYVDRGRRNEDMFRCETSDRNEGKKMNRRSI